MNKTKTTIAISAISAMVLVGLIVASVFGWRKYQETKVVAEVKEMQTKLFDENASREDREKAMEQMRERRENMTEGQQRAFREQMMQGFQQRMERRMDEFFALSEEDRVAFLDEEIQQQEARRKEWEQRRAERDQDADRNRGEGKADRGGGRGERGGTPEEREARRDEFRRMIGDKTTPEQRAKFQAYREAMQQRREELGLPPGRGWPGGGRPGRR